MHDSKPSNLPSMKSMVNKGLLTFRKGTRISAEGIHVTKQFDEVSIDTEKLRSFSSFFGFKDAIPLPFLYLLAQRAQLALMLDRSYTLSIPGTVHLSNTLEAVGEIDPNLPFKLEGLGEVPYKASGSLLPKFQVRFYQKGGLVALCDSQYLVKRKKKKSQSSTKRVLPEIITHPDREESWSLEKGLGRKYADISDDHNPIHKSKTAARLAGFKSPIIQGWYLISRAAQVVQAYNNKTLKQIEVSFVKPVFLPGTYSFLTDSNNHKSNHASFQLLDPDEGTVLVNGSFGI